MTRLQSLLYFAVHIVIVLSVEKQNYYWEEYKGTIPSNAIRAGMNKNGQILVIGKTDKYGQEIPGYLKESGANGVLHIVHNKKLEIIKDSFKILCAEYPEQMQWITVNEKTFRHISNRNVVIGGSYESPYGIFPYLIGRKTYSNGIIVGGVTTSEFEMELIGGDESVVKGINVKENIELLSFNPYLPKKDGSKSLEPNSGYYWTDYEDFIPKNAVPGGHKNDGTPTYIGQVYFNNTIICGEVDPTTKSINFVHNGVPLQFSINIKILCAHHPEQLEWIDVNKKSFWHVWQHNIVIGGYYGLYPYLIGRSTIQNRLIIGSVPRHGWDAELFLVHDGSVKKVDTFQILTFNPYIPINEHKHDTIQLTSKNGNTYYINFY